MENQFTNIYNSIAKHKLVFTLAVLFIMSGCLFLATKINFEEDITRIIPKGDKNDLTAKVLQQLNFSDKVTVIIEAKNDDAKEKLPEAATEFLDTLSICDKYIAEIQGGFDNDQIDETFEFVYDNLPLFLDEKDYKTIANKIEKDSIESAIQKSYNTLISPTGIVAKKFILNDPLGFSFIGLNKLKSLGVTKDFDLKNGFITTQDGSTILLFITPKFPGTETDKNVRFVELMDSIKLDLNSKYEGDLNFSYFGSPFIAVANAQQIKSDIQSTVLISIGVLMLILILFYRRIYVPLILFIPAICGGLVSLMVMYFLKDSISAISISIGAVLLGITIDYSLHIITHYRENTDIKTLYKHITKPILTSSFTTAVAFLCLVFVNSEVLQDLGVFASISVIVSAIASLLIIPHLYKPKGEERKNLIDKFSGYAFHKNKILFGICIVAVIFGAFTFSKVSFNNNIADLNFVPEPIKKAESKLENIGSIGSKSIYLAVYGENIDEVVEKNSVLENKLQSLKQENTINEYSSLGGVVLSKEKQLQKIQKWNSFWENNSIDSVVKTVNNSSQNIGFNPNAFSKMSTLLNKDYEPITIKEYQEFNTLFLDEFLTEKNKFFTFSSLVKIDEEKRTKVIDALSQEDVIVIDRKHLNEQFLGQLRDDFGSLINYSFIAVFLILFVFFRRIELALMSMIPIVLTGLVTAGAMYLLDLELNIFSTIVTTLILGLGIDFSIFMTSGLQHRYSTGQKVLTTYRTSIVLAVITTVLALGALIFAKHPALKSISVVSLIGIFSAVTITFVFYPKIFELFIEKRPKKGKSPITLRLFLTAIASFFYYGFGGVLYSLFGIIFMAIVPVKKEVKEKWYRKVIAKFLKSVMHSNYGIKKEVRNPYNEEFKEPAIVIPNHSSFLDTLSMGMIKMRFIFLVNDWVYNSPIFGKAVQLAGYYPVSSGIEGGEEKLIKMIEKGYNLIIFPEGTRSKTGDIGRFHKGAFHLAKKYNIDIVPLYIHGNGDLLPKGDFIIFDGKQTIEVGKRIKFNSEKDLGDVKAITKKISIDYKNKFKEIRYREEGVDYFKHKIYLNFLYKNNEIVKGSKLEFQANKTIYHTLNKFIPSEAKIVRLGNDYGIWDLILVFQEAKRKVFSYILDKELRNIAKQSYLLKQRKIHYSNNISELKGDVLLITTICSSEVLKSIVSNNSFHQIIIMKNVQNSNDLFKFGYKVLNEDTNFVILNKPEIGK
ncbi:MAG: MMPL family transporter [Brumimicrobium sp.]